MSVKQNWADSQDLALMYRGTYPPEFYRVLHAVTHKKFRIWQSNTMLRVAVRRPWEVTPAVARRLGASVYHRLTLPFLERKLGGQT
jgi:anaerobic magnesium-protoporphyrin IX monomethyl ester cyclase